MRLDHNAQRQASKAGKYTSSETTPETACATEETQKLTPTSPRKSARLESTLLEGYNPGSPGRGIS